MAWKKIVGTTDPTNNWATEAILERDKDGEPSKVAKKDKPENLTASEVSKLESIGFVVEDSSKEEAEEYVTNGQPVVGDDIVGSGPSFNTPIPEVTLDKK